jgi:2'-5' RNA ligase
MAEDNEAISKNLKRCFICIDLPLEAKKYLNEVQEIIKKKNLFQGKFTEFENLHLTLKFLGEIEEIKILEAEERLRKIKFNAFDIYLGEVGVFSERFANLIWIKLGGKSIFDLQKQVEDVLGGLFEAEKRFMSHVTIARPKKVFDKNLLLDYFHKMKIKKECFNMDRFFLKSSDLKEDGPVYSTIKEFSAEKE